MEKWIRDLIDREKAARGVPLEVKPIGNNHYLYQVTSIYDKATRKRRKVSKYIGRVDENGVVIKNSRSIFEYGNSRLLCLLADDIEPLLRRCFPDHYGEIIAISMIRNIAPTPIRLMKSRWEKLYSSQEMDADLSPNAISSMLKLIGSDQEAQRTFFSGVMQGSRYLIFDMSSIFSRSENIRIAERGYNPRHIHIKQISMVMLFSHSMRKPVLLKPVPGSLRDPKAFAAVAKDYSLKNCVIIADRGSSPSTFRKIRGMGFIVPLRSDSKVIDYHLGIERSFSYNGRGINASSKRIGKEILYVFEDTMLRYEQESNFIALIGEGKRRQQDLTAMRPEFGKIPVLSNMYLEPEEAYRMWKTREEIEESFDIMKNDLEEDKTYLQDDDAVRGYFFTILTALYLRYGILNTLKEKGLNGKISVSEVLLELSKTYMIIRGSRRTLSEIPKKAEKMEEIMGMKLFPKILRS